jgi:hypothetical protein
LLSTPLGAACPTPGQLEEALRIVAVANPVLVAEAHALDEVLRQRDWEAVLNIGYDSNTTYETGAAGARAAVTVKIPLFDRTGSAAKAKAKADLVGVRDSTTAAFLADIQTLCGTAASARALDMQRAFERDRLTYRQERVNQGLDPPDRLWADAASMQSGEQAWGEKAAALDVLTLTMARRYGGEEWERLMTLLSAMTR